MASHTQKDPANAASIENTKQTTIDLVGGIYCHICHSIFTNKKNFDPHYVNHETAREDIIYTCVICLKEISGYQSFRGHCYSRHVIKKRLKCRHCDKSFSKTLALKEHVNTVHRFECSDCKKEFTTKRELQLHQIIHNTSNMPPFDCLICSKQINTLEICKEHVNLHSSSIYFCPICSENIPSIDNAAEHLKNHFGDNDETPQIKVDQEKGEKIIERLGGILCKCQLTFKNRIDFDAHFSCLHGSDDIAYTCCICAKQFDKYSLFSVHSYDHFMKNNFCCDICFKSFDRLSRLVTHMSLCQANTDGNKKQLSCFICDRKYADEKWWRCHLKDVHNIHCLTCPVEDCKKVFQTLNALTIHQQAHHSQQNFCRLCGLVFISIKSCERHLDTHSKKLYVCPVCNRNYSDKSLMLKHISQHFQDVLHFCKICGKLYNAKYRLIEHLKSHEKVKIYSCTYCGKGFMKLGQLQGHLNTHTGSKPYKCPICDKTFANYPNWHKHLRRMHELDSKSFKNNMETPENKIQENNIKEIDIATKPNTLTVDKLEVEQEPFINKRDDSTMELDGIVNVVIEKELEILENPVCNRECKETFVISDLPTESTTQLYGEPSHQNLQPTNFPAEYGPEFNTNMHTDGTAFLDLDDHMLPHIDPLLTINCQYSQEQTPIDPAAYKQAKWEPIITKVEGEYSFGYGDMIESSRLSMMNTDIF